MFEEEPMPADENFISRLVKSTGRLFAGETAPGVLLIAAAAAAMICANSWLARGYDDLLHDPLAWTPIAKLSTAHLWINDALMAVFFFAVGLEIKREILAGELSDAKRRRLPVLAAAAGMQFPRSSISASPEPRSSFNVAGRSPRRPISLSHSASLPFWDSASPRRYACSC